jgi:hypothetical protein
VRIERLMQIALLVLWIAAGVAYVASRSVATTWLPTAARVCLWAGVAVWSVPPLAAIAWLAARRILRPRAR